MAQTLALTAAIVKYTPGTPRDTQYGPRINAVLTLPDGCETKLSGNPDDATLLTLKKGQRVQVAWDGKGYKLATTAPVEPPSQPALSNGNRTAPTPTGWTPDEKRAIASSIEEKAKLMKFCLEQARKHCGDYLESSQDLMSVAIVLFGEAVK